MSVLRLLFVCTGNICRSPSAEYLLRARLQDKLAGGAERISVSSAGLGTPGDWEIDPRVGDLLRDHQIEGSEKFRSRPVRPDLLAGTDLVLTGTKRHRLSIGADFPESYSRTFTMREAASLLTHADPTGLPPYDLLERGRAAIGLLQRERGTRALTDDEFDIADPHGRRPAAYRKMFEDVQAVVDTLAFVLAPATVRTPQQHPL